MSVVSFGNYYPGNSLIHRLDPRVKIVASLILMIAVFFFSSPLPLLFYGVVVLGLVLLAKIDLKTVLGTVKPVLFITSFAFLLNLFSVPGQPIFSLGFLTMTYEGLETGILMALRLILLIMGSSVLLTLTTTSLLFADSIESLLGPLKRLRVPVHDLAMMISIALRFIPTLADEAEKIMKAQSSRGANYDSGRFMQRIRGLVTILIPLFVNAIKRAEELATAMEARCYRGGEQRTKMNVLRMQCRDYVFLAVVSFLTVLMFVLQYAF